VYIATVVARPPRRTGYNKFRNGAGSAKTKPAIRTERIGVL